MVITTPATRETDRITGRPTPFTFCSWLPKCIKLDNILKNLIFRFGKKQKFLRAWLEHATTRSTVSCSTIWAIRGCWNGMRRNTLESIWMHWLCWHGMGEFFVLALCCLARTILTLFIDFTLVAWLDFLERACWRCCQVSDGAHLWLEGLDLSTVQLELPVQNLTHVIVVLGDFLPLESFGFIVTELLLDDSSRFVNVFHDGGAALDAVVRSVRCLLCWNYCMSVDALFMFFSEGTNCCIANTICEISNHTVKKWTSPPTDTQNKTLSNVSRRSGKEKPLHFVQKLFAEKLSAERTRTVTSLVSSSNKATNQLTTIDTHR